jgi:putative ABC transport system permease protein
MIRNYITIAWRNLLKNRLFSFINIFGLALSMSVCMMVMVRLIDNFSYDRFHPDAAHTFRIISNVKNIDGREWSLASTPLPLHARLQEDQALIDACVSLYSAVHDNASNGEKEIFLNGAFTQPSFFKVFGFSLVAGNPMTALGEPNSIVIDQATAKKFFGDENPLGQLLSFDKLGSFQITGVLRDAPGKSHINFDVFISESSISLLEKNHKLLERLNNWSPFEHAYTYVLINKNNKRANLDAALARISAEINKGSTSGTFTLETQALTSITPGIEIYNEIGRGGTWGKIIIEMGVAIIILLAACFNYTNLSIARALTRMREVGIRKIAGARRSQIFTQYIVESVLVAVVALIFAQVLLSFIMEYKPFNDGYEFVPEMKIGVRTFGYFLFFALFAGILAGALPAWILSSFRAVKMLKNVAVEKIMGGLTWRKMLIVFQFSLSLVILIFLSAFYKQFSFMASADNGFQRKNILSIPITSSHAEILATAIASLSGVEGVTALSNKFGGRTAGTTQASMERGNSQPINLDYYFADKATISVMDLRLMAGKSFSETNTAFEKQIILNQKAVELLGFKNIRDAIGAKIWVDDSLEMEITGVIADFYHKGVGRSISPMALRNKVGAHNYLMVRFNPASKAAMITPIETIFKKLNPDNAFSFQWIDQELHDWNDQSASISLLGFLAFMTVAIASLGLLGLVVYTVEIKRKEIGIRKIIGASIHQIMTLLSKGFVGLLLIAGVIALPIGFALSKLFLMNFAKQVDFGIGTLILSFVFLLTVGLSMITSQTYKASVENPVKSLRSE